jgi:hypothetical protein
LPNYVLHQDEDRIILRNYKHKSYIYKNYKDKLNPQKPEKKNSPEKIAAVKRNGTNGKKRNGKSKLKVIDFTDIELPVPQYEEIEN